MCSNQLFSKWNYAWVGFYFEGTVFEPDPSLLLDYRDFIVMLTETSR